MRKGFLRPGLLIWLLSALSASAAIDTTIPLVGSSCTLQSDFIRRDEMVARMLSQYGATSLGLLPLVDGRALETFHDPVKGLWFQTILRRVKTPTVWEARNSAWQCWFAESDPVFIPPKI